LSWGSFLGSASDCLERYYLRFNEIIESVRIMFFALLLVLGSMGKASRVSTYSRPASGQVEGATRVARGSILGRPRSPFSASIPVTAVEASSFAFRRPCRRFSITCLRKPRVGHAFLKLSIVLAPSMLRLSLLAEERGGRWESTVAHLAFGSSMELVIEEFLQFFPFLFSLFGFARVGIESSKGLYSLFLAQFPWSINFIANDFLAISQLNKFCKAINIGDLIAVLGSIDFVLGSVDL